MDYTHPNGGPRDPVNLGRYCYAPSSPTLSSWSLSTASGSGSGIGWYRSGPSVRGSRVIVTCRTPRLSWEPRYSLCRQSLRDAKTASLLIGVDNIAFPRPTDLDLGGTTLNLLGGRSLGIGEVFAQFFRGESVHGHIWPSFSRSFRRVTPSSW
jgi:hypothetical protein